MLASPQHSCRRGRLQSCGSRSPGPRAKAAIAHSTPGQRSSLRVFGSLDHARGRLLTRKRPSGSPSEPWAARQANQRMCRHRQRRPPTRIKPSRPRRPKPRPRTSSRWSSRTQHPRRPRRLRASRARWELPRIQRHPRRPRNLRAHAGGPSASPPREGTSSRTGKRRRRRPRRSRRARTRRARRPPGACRRRRSAWTMT